MASLHQIIILVFVLPLFWLFLLKYILSIDEPIVLFLVCMMVFLGTLVKTRETIIFTIAVVISTLILHFTYPYKPYAFIYLIFKEI